MIEYKTLRNEEYKGIRRGDCAFAGRRNKKISSRLILGGVFVAPPTGLEPATYGLTVRRSTD